MSSLCRLCGISDSKHCSDYKCLVWKINTALDPPYKADWPGAINLNALRHLVSTFSLPPRYPHHWGLRCQSHSRTFQHVVGGTCSQRGNLSRPNQLCLPCCWLDSSELRVLCLLLLLWRFLVLLEHFSFAGNLRISCSRILNCPRSPKNSLFKPTLAVFAYMA